MGRALGVSGQLVRDWLDPTKPEARPRPAYILAWAIEAGVPVEAIDPAHPRAGGRWIDASSPDGDGGEYAPGDSNPEPSGVVPLRTLRAA